MRKKIRVKPSKEQSFIGFFVGIVFCFIGLFVAIPLAGAFGVIWAIFAVIITVSHYKNAFTDKGVATHEIVIEDASELNDGRFPDRTETQRRLEDLKHLYDNNFLSKEEYEEKRRNIINGI